MQQVTRAVVMRGHLAPSWILSLVAVVRAVLCHEYVVRASSETTSVAAIDPPTQTCRLQAELLRVDADCGQAAHRKDKGLAVHNERATRVGAL